MSATLHSLITLQRTIQTDSRDISNKKRERIPAVPSSTNNTKLTNNYENVLHYMNSFLSFNNSQPTTTPSAVYPNA